MTQFLSVCNLRCCYNYQDGRVRALIGEAARAERGVALAAIGRTRDQPRSLIGPHAPPLYMTPTFVKVKRRVSKVSGRRHVSGQSHSIRHHGRILLILPSPTPS